MDPSSKTHSEAFREMFSKLFVRIEELLVCYIDPFERRMARSWLEETRRGVYANGFGAARHVLLSALDKSRIGNRSVGEVGVLERKYGPYSELFWRVPDTEGGFVSSPLDKTRLNELSDNNWIGIITSSRVANSYQERRNRFQSPLRSSTVRDFAFDFRVASARQPERFVLLASRLSKSTNPDYLCAALSAASLVSPSQEVPSESHQTWRMASQSAVSQLLERTAMSDNEEIAKALLHVIGNRDDLQPPESVLDAVRRLIRHVDPIQGQLYASKGDGIDDGSIEVLHTNSIKLCTWISSRYVSPIDQPWRFEDS